MAANKKASRSGGASTPKKKASAVQHAQSRAQAQQHLPETPRLRRRSHQEVSQSRFPGETPLTGEDRPSDRPGGKQQGFAQDRQVRGAQGRRTPIDPGEATLRRGRGKKGPSARAD